MVWCQKDIFVLTIAWVCFSSLKRVRQDLDGPVFNMEAWSMDGGMEATFICRTLQNIHLKDVSNILGEYRRAETLLNLVVPANPFVKAWALQQVHDGGKCLPENTVNCQTSLKMFKPKQVWMPLPVNHRRIMGKTGDNGGLHIVAFPGQKRMCKKVVLVENNNLSMIFPPNSIFPPAALASSMVWR